MNTRETSEIRDLAADEINQVSAGDVSIPGLDPVIMVVEGIANAALVLQAAIRTTL